MFDKLISLLEKCWRFLLFFTVVDAYEAGVVLRFGRFHRKVEPGLVFFWPGFVERVLTVNVVVETMNIGPQSLTTKDGKEVVISTIITFTKEDVKVFLLSTNGGDRVLEDAAPGVIAKLVMERNYQDLLDMDMGNELTKKIRVVAKRYGVFVQQVAVSDFAKVRSLRLMQSVTNTYSNSKEF